MASSFDLAQLARYSRDFVGVNITGLKETVKNLNDLYPAAANAGVEAANKYIVDTLKGPEGYAPYQYVSWRQVGGPATGGFYTERQRRFVMAALASGEIPTPGTEHRTGRMKQGWHTVGKGREQTIENETPDAIYTMSPTAQARMHRLQAWDTVPAWLNARGNQIRAAFAQGVQKVIEAAQRATDYLSSVAP